jgi:ATP/maltotriose-dependent transcriptional regulator MalT
VSAAESRISSPSSRAAVQAQHAHLLASNGRPREALRVLDEIDAMVDEDLADPRLRIEVASARSIAELSVGRFDQACAAARLGARTQAELPEWLSRRGMASHLVNEAHALAYGGRYREARALIEAAVTPAHQRGAAAAEVWFHVVLGEIERDCGYASAAIGHFEVAAVTAESAGQQAALVWAWVGVAQGHLLLGEVDAADAALERVTALGESPLATSWSTAERTRAWLMAGRGDLPAARKRLVDVAEVLRADGIWSFEASLLHDLVRFGDPDAAVDRLDSLADFVEGPLVQAFACHARAAASMDRTAYADALERFEAMDKVVAAAEVALELADVLRRHGDSRGAAAASRRSRRLVEASGGARTPPLLRGVAIEPLTKREREVALLAATGLQSREIAERLTVSKRTIDTHLDRIYRKLGVHGREHLANALEPDTTT